MRRNFLALAMLVTLSVPALAEGPSRAKLGEKIPNLVFHDEKGQAHALYELKNQKAIVLAFLSFECPVSTSYSQPLAEMNRDFGKHGIAFIGLTVNEDDTPAQVAKQARDFNLGFPVYRDRDLLAARAVEADFTPEVFVLDADFVLRYRGRVDDSYVARLKKHAQATRQDLRQVIGEILSGRPVSEPATQAIGCTIARDVRNVAKAGPVTYYRDVLPILQNNCQSCHRPGEVGPFSLMNYRQAVNWAPDIKSYTQNRTMPPWKPTAGVAMHNERHLGDADIATLANWADNGTPAGDPADAPPARVFPDGWHLGKPDLVLQATEEFVVGPTGKDRFRCFVLPTNLPEDVHVTAVEIRPGNPRVVHHVLPFIDTTGQARKLEAAEKEKKPVPVDELHPEPAPNPEWDKGPGYTVGMGIGFLPQGGLMGWAPGILPRHLPDNAGFILPKNCDVVMQVHYHRNGRLERDRTQIGLYFAKKPIDRPYAGGVVAGGKGAGPFRLFFSIPAGEDKFKLTGEAYAHRDFTLYSLSPHMHMLGKEIHLTMTPPGESTRTLISVGQWDYNWQEIYFLKEPIHVKAGTRFQVDAIYDNSDKNAMNPFNPPRRVTFGEQTFNEMCFVFLGGTNVDNTGFLGRARILPVASFAPSTPAPAATP